jgi:hypothetical protein
MAWLSTLLQSLPFAQSVMLLWGLAAGLPIIIHLWNKRKYHETTWAAMEYLLAAVRKNARRIRIEQLILLLIRVAILLLLAMALADPIWSLFPSLGSSLGSSGRTHFLLVIDSSYSMDYRDGETSRFQRALEWAGQVVQDSRQGDGFSLVLMADPPRVVIGEPAFDPDDVLEELDGLKVLHGGADLPTTLAELGAVLKLGQREHAWLSESTICFFTDLGTTTWGEVTDAACREQIGRLGNEASLVLFDVGQSTTDNLAVTRLEVREPLVTIAREVAIEAEVENFGVQGQESRRLLFYVDNQQVHNKVVQVAAGGRTTVSVPHRFETPGEHRVEARLAEDALPIDNHRWASVPVRESIRVLCVEGREGAARHIAYALQPEHDQRPRVRPETRSENAVLETDLGQFDCVFLCNVGRFSRDETGVLHNYLKNGGGLIFTLGDQVQLQNYNERLGGKSSPTRVLPARLDEISPDAQYFFDPLQYRHPIVKPFSGHERTGLLTTPVWRFVRVTPYDPVTAKTALAFLNGDPAIVEEPIERGRSILLTTAVSPQSVDRSTTPPTPWSAFASWPSFPPLVQEMLALAVRGYGRQRNLRVGDAIVGQRAETTSSLPLAVLTPDGRSERIPLKVDGEFSRWVFNGTQFSGVYEAELGDPADEVQLFAVNVDTRESNPARFDRQLLPSQFRQDLGLDETESTVSSTRPSQFFRHFLGMVLILLLVETYLAWRFGNASA